MNLNKITTTIVVGIIIIVGGGYFLIKGSSSTQTTNPTSSVAFETTNPNANNTQTSTNKTTSKIPTPTTTNTGTKQYTLAEVATHNSVGSCWTTINGKVYDVTSWINQHPGGQEAILSLCGIDGSSAFNDQHGGQRRPANELATFIIGDLKN
jgi:cytochrome b involved in lipid metabolism